MHSSDIYVKAVTNLFVESFPTHFPGPSTNRNHPVVRLQSTHLVIVGEQTSRYSTGRVDVCTVVGLQRTCNNIMPPDTSACEEAGLFSDKFETIPNSAHFLQYK